MLLSRGAFLTLYSWRQYRRQYISHSTYLRRLYCSHEEEQTILILMRKVLRNHLEDSGRTGDRCRPVGVYFRIYSGYVTNSYWRSHYNRWLLKTKAHPASAGGTATALLLKVPGGNATHRHCWSHGYYAYQRQVNHRLWLSLARLVTHMSYIVR